MVSKIVNNKIVKKPEKMMCEYYAMYFPLSPILKERIIDEAEKYNVMVDYFSILEVRAMLHYCYLNDEKMNKKCNLEDSMLKLERKLNEGKNRNVR